MTAAPIVAYAFEYGLVLGSSGVDWDEIKRALEAAIRAALATLSPPAGERREAIARLKRLRNVMHASRSNNLLMQVWDDDLRSVDAALAILASGLVQDEAGWRTMDTAPKDGRMVQLIFEPAEEPGMGFGIYRDEVDSLSPILPNE